jgi:hypothetical protein
MRNSAVYEVISAHTMIPKNTNTANLELTIRLAAIVSMRGHTSTIFPSEHGRRQRGHARTIYALAVYNLLFAIGL